MSGVVMTSRLRVVLVDGRHELLLRSGVDRRVARDRPARCGRAAAAGADRGRRSRPDPPRVSLVAVLVVFFPARPVEFTEPPAGPVESRAHGADGDAEGVGDLLVARAPPTRAAGARRARAPGSDVTAAATRCQRLGGVDAPSSPGRRRRSAAGAAPRAAPSRAGAAPRGAGAWPAGWWRCRTATAAPSAASRS